VPCRRERLTANGLEPIVLPLCAEPERYQVVLAIVDCKEIKTDTDTGEVIPTMRIRRIEAITGLDKPAARTDDRAREPSGAPAAPSCRSRWRPT
jgi:hypothetical protein